METLEKQFPAHDFALLAIVLALPLIGAFVNGVFGKRLGKPAVRLMALSALGGSFLASVVTFLEVLRRMREVGEGQGPNAAKLMWTAWTWLVLPTRGGKPLDVTFSVDLMTATMMLVVTGVGFLIHLYSTEYMIKDAGYHRFFAYLNLFCFSMLVLIMGDSLPVLFVGWEGVGLCSYLLIGFWFEEEKNASAGKKAFITNRIGDFGLLIAMAMLLYYTGALDWAGIKIGAHGLSAPVKVWPIGNLPGVHDLSGIPNLAADQLLAAQRHDVDVQFPSLAKAPAFLSGAIYWLLSEHYTTAATLVGLALFLGCAGKSAQIPLYVWLPDAMAGPTPVSALIHAATMVTAGVYLVARMSFVFVLSPAVMATVAVIGAATALFAASMGLLQKDLKKVLAYSTVSQLGYMFIGVGTGAFVAGFFHVFTHAFFKACLFLGAGSVIHAMHARIHDTDGSQDMTNMGGLRKYMPHTHWTFLASCLSIAGCPFLAGFWSKDEILWKAYSSQINPPVNAAQMHMWLWPTWLGPAIYWAGIIGATMTAFYMFRAYFLTFWGEFRGWKIKPGWKDKGHHHHGHHEEDPTKRVGPVPHESPWAMTVPLIILGTLAVVAGFFGAEALHVAPLTHHLEASFEGLNQVAMRSGVGEGQVWAMMVPGVLAFVVGTGAAYVVYALGGGAAERSFQTSFPGLYSLIYDKWRIDELYDATVIGMVDALADIFVMADQWFVDGILAKLTALLVSGTGSLLRLFQTGRVQVYAASMAVGVVGVGWFMTTPHAAYSKDETALSTTGEVVVKPAPGLGYEYKWSGDGVQKNDYSGLSDYSFVVEPGKTRKVTLEVKNAFGRETTETITVSRPTPKPGEGGPMFLQARPAPDQPAASDNSGKDKGIIKVDGAPPATPKGGAK